MDEDERNIRMTILTESWADLRAYSSNIWQITTILFTVVSFVASILINQINTSESFVLSGLDWFLSLLIVILTGYTTYFISGIIKSIDQRIELIRENETKLTKIKQIDFAVIVGDQRISSNRTPKSLRLTRALSWIPVQPILNFFYIFLSFNIGVSVILSILSFSENVVSLMISLSFLTLIVFTILMSLRSLRFRS